MKLLTFIFDLKRKRNDTKGVHLDINKREMKMKQCPLETTCGVEQSKRVLNHFGNIFCFSLFVTNFDTIETDIICQVKNVNKPATNFD